MRPKKRSFSVRGHRTSLSLEEPFWSALKEIAEKDGQSLAELVGRIDAQRGETGLSTAVRLYILEHYRHCRSAVQPPDSAAPSPERSS